MRYADTDVPPGMRWAPTSRPGRWAVTLAAAAVAGVAISVVGFATGVLRSASSFSDNWSLTLWATAILVTGAASAVTGAVAILRRRDRAWSVWLATFLGVCVTALLLNEVAEGL